MQAEGYPHPCNEVEGAERSGGLHKRSAEDWGDGLYAREGETLLGIKDELAPYRTDLAMELRASWGRSR